MKNDNQTIGIIMLCGTLISIVALAVKYDLENKETESDNIPAFYWNDRVNPPHNGFELKVDMYWNETKDTIYMEYSSGPEGE